MVLRKLKLFLIVLVVISSGCEESGALTESDRRELLQRVDAKDLMDYCVLLEHLYDDPVADKVVVETLERLVWKNIFVFRIAKIGATELGYETIDALLAFLKLSENDAFGRTWDRSYVFDSEIAYLKSIEATLIEHREYLKTLVRVE